MSAHEADPRGLSAHTPGAKLDAGKPRPTLVMRDMRRALMAVMQVAEHGATKYSDGGWLQVRDARERYRNAQIRHIMAELGGELYDPDSTLLHAAHDAWNALAHLELVLRDLQQPQQPARSFTLVAELPVCRVCEGHGLIHSLNEMDPPMLCAFCNGQGNRHA
jgi:hypothetical protein